MDLTTILTVHREPIIEEWVYRLQTEVSPRYMEKEYIIGILQRTHWHLGKTCALAGISRPTLRHKHKTYGLVRDFKPF
jgi:transcriptional regulator of acetoin/glycerol metabolism